MRRPQQPRDFRAEKKAVEDRIAELDREHITGLGQLIIDLKAGHIEPIVLAGLIIEAQKNLPKMEAFWRGVGLEFFRRTPRQTKAASKIGAAEEVNPCSETADLPLGTLV